MAVGWHVSLKGSCPATGAQDDRIVRRCTDRNEHVVRQGSFRTADAHGGDLVRDDADDRAWAPLFTLNSTSAPCVTSDSRGPRLPPPPNLFSERRRRLSPGPASPTQTRRSLSTRARRTEARSTLSHHHGHELEALHDQRRSDNSGRPGGARQLMTAPYLMRSALVQALSSGHSVPVPQVPIETFDPVRALLDRGNICAMTWGRVAVVVVAFVGVAACSSSKTTTGPTLPSTTAPVANAACGDPVGDGWRWPITGAAQTTSWARLSGLAAHFVAAEFGLSPGAARVEQRRDDCIVHVQVGGRSAAVQIVGRPSTYRVNGLNYPDPQPDIGTSIEVRGRTVDVHSPLCSRCVAKLKIRYRNEVAEQTSRDGEFHIDLGKRPSGPGTLVLIVTRGGTVVRAERRSSLRAGNFRGRLTLREQALPSDHSTLLSAFDPSNGIRAMEYA